MSSLKSFKPILVTGGAKRIGLAIAQRFADLGHPVIIHASPRTAEAAEAETKSLVKSGVRARCIIADLSKYEETAGLIKQASQIYGPVETLVNNASVFEVDVAENFDLNLYETHMAVN
ncbi:MAG: SDR family NAD(P)-dependent oxidoreductase, partial [Methylocystis sp.]